MWHEEEGAHPTPDEARRRIRSAIAHAATRMAIVEEASAFEVNAWNDGAPVGSRRGVRIEIRRPPRIGETPEFGIGTGPLAWGAHVERALHEHLERLRHAIERERLGYLTQSSAGDPLHSLHIHRFALEVLALHRVEISGLRAWTDLMQRIRARMSLGRLILDAGRIHFAGLKIRLDGNAQTASLGACMLANQPRATLTVAQRFPEAAIVSLAGRRLRDVLEMEGLSEGHVIFEATHCDAYGTRIMLEHDDVSLARAA